MIVVNVPKSAEVTTRQPGRAASPEERATWPTAKVAAHAKMSVRSDFGGKTDLEGKRQVVIDRAIESLKNRIVDGEKLDDGGLFEVLGKLTPSQVEALADVIIAAYRFNTDGIAKRIKNHIDELERRATAFVRGGTPVV